MNGLAIYVTHGSPVTLKIASRAFDKVKPAWQVHAIFNKDNDAYTIYQAPLDVNLPKKTLDLTEFMILINQLKAHPEVDINEIVVCCDANLGVSGGHVVTDTVDSLLHQIKPQTVCFFNSTPECSHDAQKYLNRERCANGFLLPLEITKGFVADRTRLSDAIKQSPSLPGLIRKAVSETTATTASESERLLTPKNKAIDTPKHAQPNVIRRYLCWFKKNSVIPSNEETRDESEPKFDSQNNPTLKP